MMTFSVMVLLDMRITHLYGFHCVWDGVLITDDYHGIIPEWFTGLLSWLCILEIF
jgi:hypothetical protein